MQCGHRGVFPWVLSSQKWPASSPTPYAMQHGASREICIDDDLGSLMESAGEQEPDVDVDPEDALIVVYTSGTTGFPKGAVISHRAMVARAALFHLCIGGDKDDAFIAWSGMFHMAGADFCVGTLLLGGRVVVVDGLDFPAIADAVAKYPVSYLGLQPGMVRRVVEYFEANNVVPKRIKAIGAMADLVAPTDLADVTRTLRSPYLNTFGSTETGMAPASAGLLAIGEVPDRLSKRETPLTLVRLIDEDGRDVGFDTPGECLVRSPALFSGYWKDEGATCRAFEGGWYHTGDVLTRHADGSFDYVERKSSMIKSGGENIYPAEIERVLLCDVRVTEACVVGAPDEKWGEVPVAFVARTDESFDSECALRLCRASLAGFKKPREVHFVESSWFPRSASGKIVRKEVKKKYPELLSSEKKSGRSAATGRQLIPKGAICFLA